MTVSQVLSQLSYGPILKCNTPRVIPAIPIEGQNLKYVGLIFALIGVASMIIMAIIAFTTLRGEKAPFEPRN